MISHWPAVAALVATAIAVLLVIPLSTRVPFERPSEAYLSGWFSSVTLVMVIVRITLAFVVLAMAKQRQEMEQRVYALTDTLTGLPNRRALYDKLDALERSHILQATPISVLFFDLDHFKDVNDTFGHETGDRVLKLFAATAGAHLNGSSIIARMGGEEFAAVLPGEGSSTATKTAEAIRAAFAGSAAVINGMTIGATVSAGVASNSCACDSSDIGALFRQADAALYAAKRTGRNRVEFAGTDGVTLVPATAAVRTAPRRKPRSHRAGRDTNVAANA
ncbi:GGDEF domain-containing protein [Methyloceanibacter superfactus]|uniref:GGDEF domain-containing protein n=1 Tax=Methyloceanibacter superfactus TaxID=1774969 RepID=UPI00114CA50E|nr:GGDEF domain-containing protein [Methyloceanibacter superfactus]